MTAPPSSLTPAVRYAARLAAIAVLMLLGVMRQASEASMMLAWDPSPGSEVIGYRVYVGTERGVYSQTYDVPADQTSFVYADFISGVRYYFGVAARGRGGLLSELSNEVTGIGPFSRTEPEPGLEPDLKPDLIDWIAASAALRRSVTATVIASGLGPVSSLAATDDGRVLFIEDHVRVRVLDPSTGTIATALEVRSPGVQLTHLAVDPAFERSRLVFVGESTIRGDGAGELSIVRYRELGGTLGQGAALIGRLPVPAGGAPFTVDSERNIYVAIPGESVSTSRNRDAFAGRVLGFTAEGRTLPQRAGASPIIAAGGVRPSALAWDAVARRLWVSDAEGTQSKALAHIDLANPRGDLSRLRRGEGAQGLGSGAPPLGFGVTAFAMDGQRTDDGSMSAFLISSTRHLYRATFGPDGSLASLNGVPVTRFGEPVAVALGSQQELYVAVRLWAGQTESPGFAILKLR